MKISEVYPEYVFQRLAIKRVICIDFIKGEFIELETKTAGQIRRYVEQSRSAGQLIKFYQYDEAQ